jgi:Antitoxin MazE-like
MKDRTQRERQGRRRNKMRMDGFVLVQVWVPADPKPEVVRLAAELRCAALGMRKWESLQGRAPLG